MRGGASAVARRHSSLLQSRTRSGLAPEAVPMLGTQFLLAVGQVAPEEVQIGRTTDGVAHRVDPQIEGGQPQGAVEAVGQPDHLHIQIGVLHPEDLHPELVVLAVATGLGPLVAKGGGGVPGLPGERGAVLDIGAYQGGGALGPESQGPSSPVLELVHLLAHHVAALTGPPAEDLDVLEDRGVGQPVAGRLHLGGEGGQQRLPPGGLRIEDVVGAARGARRQRFVSHRGLSPSCRGGCDRRRRRRRDDESG